MDYPGDENEQRIWGPSIPPKPTQISGADYLRSLKGDPATAAPAPQPLDGKPAAILGQQPSVFPGPRREHRRFSCQGSAQIREGGSNFSSWGTINDISMGGCYLEIAATIPQETILHMNLEVNGNRFQVKGTVRATYPMLGAGVKFTEVSQEDRARLEEVISAFAASTKTRVW